MLRKKYIRSINENIITATDKDITNLYHSIWILLNEVLNEDKDNKKELRAQKIKYIKSNLELISDNDLENLEKLILHENYNEKDNNEKKINEDIEKIIWIYVLKLNSNKYYVGRTDRNVNDRFLEHCNPQSQSEIRSHKCNPQSQSEIRSHKCNPQSQSEIRSHKCNPQLITNDCESNIFNTNGASWTRLYKPLEILEVYQTNDNFDEDKYTIKMMSKFGIDNVRGGSFVNEKLTNEQIDIIKKMINNGIDGCFKCGSKDHYINQCSHKDEIIENTSVSEIINKMSKFKSYRCKAYCCRFCGKVFSTMKGATHHENIYCVKNPNRQTSKNNCIRCGNIGHSPSYCYAKRHINGNYLKD